MQATDSIIIRKMLRAIDAAAFKEADHPRAKGGPHAGEFAKKGTSGPGGASAKPSAKTGTPKAGATGPAALPPGMFSKKHPYLVTAPKDRNKWPAHIKAQKLPPAWTDIVISPDPDAALLAMGRDAKGKKQPRYNPAFTKTKDDGKWKRAAACDKLFPTMLSENEQALKDPKKREFATIAKLVMNTGIRVSSDTETMAEKEAFGAKSLQGRHVKIKNGQMLLDFSAKKGTHAIIPVKDPALVKELQARAQKAGPQGELFPDIKYKELNEYFHSLDHGKFSAKDFRTRHGSKRAMEEIKKMPVPKSPAEYKKAVKRVAEVVSTELCNTPAMALKAYITPQVWTQWKQAAGA